eukprot:1724558-Rhodomonas_salina.1
MHEVVLLQHRKSTGMQRFWYCTAKEIEIPISPRHGGTLVGEWGKVVTGSTASGCSLVKILVVAA